MTKPKVSIVMPVYNAERYLKEALDSIIHQTYQNLEILCVDDGSTDSSPEMLQAYARADSRIQILTQKNQYAGAARNNGMDRATGKYIMFLDSDDTFKKNMVAYLVHKAEKCNPDIVTFGYYMFVETSTGKRPVKNRFRKERICSAQELDNLYQVTRSMPWDKFLNLEFVRSAGIRYDQTKVNNDVYFNRMICAKARKILFCTKRFVNYRIRNAASLQGGINKNPTDFLVALEKIFRGLQDNQLISAFRSSYIRMALDDIILHFQQTDSFEGFQAIIQRIRDIGLFDLMEIDASSELLRAHPFHQTLAALVEGDASECLANLYFETRKQSVSKASIEYQIGYRLLRLLHLEIRA